MYYVITDNSGLILKDAFGVQYKTNDPARRDGFRQRAEELGGKLLEIDSPVWPPASHVIATVAGEDTIREKTESEKIADGWILFKDAMFGKLTRLSQLCNASITAGFISNALGTDHFYNSGLENQMNLADSKDTTTDMPYTCYEVSTAGIPIDATGIPRVHNPAQINAVYQKGKTRKLTFVGKYHTLKAELLAITDPVVLSAWNPENKWIAAVATVV